MKRSKPITLVLLGTLGVLAGCDNAPDTQQVQTRQQSYASLDDCKKDWANDSRNCSTSSSGHVYGPRYFWNHSGGYPVVIDNGGTQRPVMNSHFANPGTSSMSMGRATGSNVGSASVPSTSPIGRAVAPMASTSSSARGSMGSTASSFSSSSAS